MKKIKIFNIKVLSIWEGTTNILSLDALRSIQKSKGESLKILAKYIQLACEQARQREELIEFSKLISKLTKEVTGLVAMDSELIQTAAREYAFSLYRLFTGKFILKRIE
jgi:putative acyl-CoA dehydrogenase